MPRSRTQWPVDGRDSSRLSARARWPSDTPGRRITAALSSIVTGLALAGCGASDEPAGEARSPAPAPPPTFVGGAVCTNCHAEQHAAWAGSHHDEAMQAASDETVLGDFDNASFTYGDVTSTFFRRDGAFWTDTDGPDGRVREFRITHTFGVEPLQQYLIKLPDGRRQALSIAWDTRPPAEGGQRWFHLYPGGDVDSDDPLHWTGPYQSWNAMCADCHSTNVVKSYNAAADSFATTFSSVDVDCEACHGPGSAHAAAPAESTPLLPRTERAWVRSDGEPTAQLRSSDGDGGQVEICARCHARRSRLTDAHGPGDALYDGLRPALLEAGLYHADGQILDEVYVYGSFLQSAMHAAGVVCSDCHEPHAASLRAEGNALCTRCHAPAVFDEPSHHRHEAGSPGAQCASCHMREQTYMVVDPRADHSFRVPRPDLTAAIGVPNACRDCHDEQSASWAAERVAEWFPDGRQGTFHYGEALHAGRTWARERSALLTRVIEDAGQPAIVRASALGLLAEQLDDAALGVLERALASPDVAVQLAAVEALSSVPAERRAGLGQRFLTHERRALRMAAARALLSARGALSERRRADLDAALGEYLETQRFNADRPEGPFNTGGVLAEQGRPEAAERAYRQALERDPAFAPAYVNLADLYRQSGREDDAAALLREGLAAAPGDARLRVALGLWLVRDGRTDEALPLFEQAVSLGADDPYNAYVLGVALSSSGAPARAIDVLEAAHARFPSYREILVALATVLRDAGETERALEHARRLLELSPADPTARALVAELEAAARE